MQPAADQEQLIVGVEALLFNLKIHRGERVCVDTIMPANPSEVNVTFAAAWNEISTLGGRNSWFHRCEDIVLEATADAAMLEAQQLGPKLVNQDRRSVGRRRLTIEVSPELHARIPKICTIRGVPVNQAVREILERSFPGS